REAKGAKAELKLQLSFRYLDTNQGQSFEDWEGDGLSAHLLNLQASLNSSTPGNALGTIIKPYSVNDGRKFNLTTNMPLNSNWNHPQTLSGRKILWCKIKLQNLVRVIGYLEMNVFEVIFLDKNHDFYPSER